MILWLKPEPLLHIWDCSGQSVLLEVLQAFLTPHTMFFLMFNAYKSFGEKWFSDISTQEVQMFNEEVNETTGVATELDDHYS